MYGIDSCYKYPYNLGRRIRPVIVPWIYTENSRDWMRYTPLQHCPKELSARTPRGPKLKNHGSLVIYYEIYMKFERLKDRGWV